MCLRGVYKIQRTVLNNLIQSNFNDPTRNLREEAEAKNKTLERKLSMGSDGSTEYSDEQSENNTDKSYLLKKRQEIQPFENRFEKRLKTSVSNDNISQI